MALNAGADGSDTSALSGQSANVRAAPLTTRDLYTGSAAIADQTNKTIAAVLGEVVWLMSRSVTHRELSISALELLAMPAILLRQFRLFYRQSQPVAVVLYAHVSLDVSIRIEEGVGTILSFAEWTSGTLVRVVQVVSPFGPSEPFVDETLRSVTGRSKVTQ